jgi:hypothetical protein
MDTTIISATRGPDTYVVPSLALAEVAALSPEEREKLLTEVMPCDTVRIRMRFASSIGCRLSARL